MLPRAFHEEVEGLSVLDDLQVANIQGSGNRVQNRVGSFRRTLVRNRQQLAPESSPPGPAMTIKIVDRSGFTV